MKSTYGHPNLICINDTEVTLGTLWLKLIQMFCISNIEAIAGATKMEQEYFAQITEAIQADNKALENSTEAASELLTKEGEQK